MATELLFTVQDKTPQPALAIRLADAGLKERADIEEWVIAHPEIIGPDVLVVTSEFAGWASKRGAKDADRLDILGLAKDGRLVVTELKRGTAPSTVEMQVLNYAARASLFTTEQLTRVHHQFRKLRGHDGTLDSARDHLEGWAPELSDETLRDTPRLVLVAEDFGLDVTTTAVFLARQFQVDIQLVRLAAYSTAAGELVISVSRTFPPPDMDEMLLFPNIEQEQEKKLAKAKEKNTVARLLAAEAIADGTELRFSPGGEVSKADLAGRQWSHAAADRRCGRRELTRYGQWRASTCPRQTEAGAAGARFCWIRHPSSLASTRWPRRGRRLDDPNRSTDGDQRLASATPP